MSLNLYRDAARLYYPDAVPEVPIIEVTDCGCGANDRCPDCRGETAARCPECGGPLWLCEGESYCPCWRYEPTGA